MAARSYACVNMLNECMSGDEFLDIVPSMLLTGSRAGRVCQGKASDCDVSDCYDDRDDVTDSLSNGGGRFLCRELGEYLRCVSENLRSCPSLYRSTILDIRNQWQSYISSCRFNLPFNSDQSSENIIDFTSNDIVENVVDAAENVRDHRDEIVDSVNELGNEVFEHVADRNENAREFIEDVIDNSLNQQPVVNVIKNTLNDVDDEWRDDSNEIQENIVEKVQDIADDASTENIIEDIVDKIATHLDDPSNAHHSESDEVSDAVAGQLGNVNTDESDENSAEDIEDIAEKVEDVIENFTSHDVNSDESSDVDNVADDNTDDGDDSSEETQDDYEGLFDDVSDVNNDNDDALEVFDGLFDSESHESDVHDSSIENDSDEDGGDNNVLNVSDSGEMDNASDEADDSSDADNGIFEDLGDDLEGSDSDEKENDDKTHDDHSDSSEEHSHSDSHSDEISDIIDPALGLSNGNSGGRLSQSTGIHQSQAGYNGVRINQRDKWAIGADLGRPSATSVANGVVILDYVHTTLPLFRLPSNTVEYVMDIKEGVRYTIRALPPRAHVCYHPRSPTDIQRGQVVGSLSSLKRFGQGPSWSPVVTVSQSARFPIAIADVELILYIWHVDNSPLISTKMSQATMMTTTAPADTASARLPFNLIPSHYDITLRPDIFTGNPANFSKTGHVSIHFRCENETDTITLHVNGLVVDENTVQLHAGQGGRWICSSNTSYDRGLEDDSSYTFILMDHFIQGRPLVLQMNFTGPLTRSLFGLYYSTYKRGGSDVYMVVTQFQPTAARNAFPCFDEPSLKATFSLTLERKPDNGYIALSNMPLIDTQPSTDGFVADRFNTTVKMSTYLVAFAICDYEYKENLTKSGILVRKN
ncbi:hypothetical protein FSP39_001064 [Pinctada imbricata]|uniref:Aminopeptidase N-like N-terminal domain-containing protein n=1 Tax=Pinctada imbricata TaxID=66713 RepID=A0AA88YD99_PINIB|nr:hypothetical protein FSP39_001064 [Pinctada imbricata]